MEGVEKIKKSDMEESQITLLELFVDFLFSKT